MYLIVIHCNPLSALCKDYPDLMAQRSVNVHVVGAETICEGDPLHLQAWDEVQAILSTKVHTQPFDATNCLSEGEIIRLSISTYALKYNLSA